MPGEITKSDGTDDYFDETPAKPAASPPATPPAKGAPPTTTPPATEAPASSAKATPPATTTGAMTPTDDERDSAMRALFDLADMPEDDALRQLDDAIGKAAIFDRYRKPVTDADRAYVEKVRAKLAAVPPVVSAKPAAPAGGAPLSLKVPDSIKDPGTRTFMERLLFENTAMSDRVKAAEARAAKAEEKAQTIIDEKREVKAKAARQVFAAAVHGQVPSDVLDEAYAAAQAIRRENPALQTVQQVVEALRAKKPSFFREKTAPKVDVTPKARPAVPTRGGKQATPPATAKPSGSRPVAHASLEDATTAFKQRALAVLSQKPKA